MSGPEYQCGTCGHRWNYDTPASRCPREADHPDPEDTNFKDRYGKIAVMHDSIMVGDLIEDLGFTVERLDVYSNGTIAHNGERYFPLQAGYEIKVSRDWDGRAEFLESLSPNVVRRFRLTEHPWLA